MCVDATFFVLFVDTSCDIFAKSVLHWICTYLTVFNNASCTIECVLGYEAIP